MCMFTHTNVQSKPSNMTQSQSVLQSLWQATMSHSFRQLRLLILAQTHKSAPHPASPLPLLAESPGWCVMPTEGHDAYRPSPQCWVSRAGEMVRAARASHWESALEFKGTFWKGRSKKWVLRFGRMAQLQMKQFKFVSRNIMMEDDYTVGGAKQMCFCTAHGCTRVWEWAYTSVNLSLSCRNWFTLSHSFISVDVCTDADLLGDHLLSKQTLW